MMADDGWTKSYRRKWRNPVFRNFRDAAVWSFLTDNAAWQDGTVVRFAGRMVTLSRGQIVTSERFLAEGFGCDRQVIRRVLDTLRNNQMTTHQQTHGGTILTICKYDEYQGYDDEENPWLPRKEPTSNPPTNPNIEEDNNSKKEDKLSSKAKRAKRTNRFFIEDEPLDPDFYAVCVEYPSINVHDEWEKFRDWHLVNVRSTGSVKLSARNWCRKAIEIQSKNRLRVVR